MSAHHHHHGHDHDHDHDHGACQAVVDKPTRSPGARPDLTGLDPANQALSEALRISFVVLKLVMVAVVLLFILSGFFHVQENEQAVVLRFGKVTGSGAERILGPGLHWSLPYPIEEIINIPGKNTIRQLEIGNFWYYQTAKEKMGLPDYYDQSKLQFTRDGYTLTASRSVISALNEADLAGKVGEDDYNIMHSRWNIHYKVIEPVPFIEQLWDGTEMGWFRVDALLRNVLAEAVIRVSAKHDIDWLIWEAPQRFGHEVELIMKEELARLGVGLEISELVLIDKVAPRQVKDAFERVTNAGMIAGRMTSKAQTDAQAALTSAKSQAEIKKADAQAYYKKIVDEARADANVLTELLAKIDQAAKEKFPGEGAAVAKLRAQEAGRIRGIFIDQFYQEMLREVIAAADEVFVPSAGTAGEVEWWTYLSRNAKINNAPKKTETRALLNPEAPKMP